MECLFFHDVHPFGSVPDDELEYSVVAARNRNQWVCVRLKGRDDWCFPGGSREKGETMEENARRELYEETGAVEYRLRPLGIYGVDHRDVENQGDIRITSPSDTSQRPGERIRISWGGFYVAEIDRFDPIPAEFEIAERRLFESFPLNRARFPYIMPGMMEWLKANISV